MNKPFVYIVGKKKKKRICCAVFGAVCAGKKRLQLLAIQSLVCSG